MGNKLRNIMVILSVLFLIAVAGQSVTAQDWNKIVDEINQDQDQALKDSAEMERVIKMDKTELNKEMSEMRAVDKTEERELDRLRKELEGLKKEEAKLTQELEAEAEEIQAIEGNVRGIAKDAYSVSRDNPITAEYPERGDKIKEIIDSRRFPGMESIRTLAKFYFQEMDEVGKIKRRTGKFVGPDGKEATGEILRIGSFTTFYRLPDGSVGFLTPNAEGKRLIAVSGDIDRWMRNGIEDYFDGKSISAPVDLSNGGYFSHLTKSEDFRDWLEKGGSVMYAILAVGIFAVLLGLERIIVLGTKARASETVMNQIKDMAIKRKWQEAKAYCASKSRIPTCQMLDSVIEHVGHTQEVLENALQEAILKQIPKLERFIPTLALLAVISPLLGLLGTVSGMITTFNVIQEVGTGDPTLMATGISEALLTTQFGLMTAIPIMLVHHFLKSQVDKIVVDMQEKGMAFAVTLVKQEGKVEE